MSPNPSPSEFFRAVFHRAPPDHFIEIRTISANQRAGQRFYQVADLKGRAEHVDRVRQLDGAANVYYGVIPRRETRGTADACASACAVWADFDEGPPVALPLPPSVVIETSPGKYQALWLLDAPSDDLALVEAINRAIATLYGADRNACDRARVLRLPGFRNLKYGDRPYSRLRVCLPEQRFTIEELERAFPPQSTPAAPVRRGDVPPSEAPSWLPLVYEAILDELAARGSGIQNLNNGGVMVRCPLHNDRDPSLSIHPTRGWKCFAGCGEGKLTMLAYKLGVAIK